MDPRKQECFGRYLYGAGYFARDDNTLSVVTNAGAKAPPHFCMRCPKRVPCEKLHERKVREARPVQSEMFDRLMAEGRHRGVGADLMKLLIGRDGRDPFALAAVENFNRGHGDRGRLDGLIVHSDADPRRR